MATGRVVTVTMDTVNKETDITSSDANHFFCYVFFSFLFYLNVI